MAGERKPIHRRRRKRKANSRESRRLFVFSGWVRQGCALWRQAARRLAHRDAQSRPVQQRRECPCGCRSNTTPRCAAVTHRV